MAVPSPPYRPPEAPSWRGPSPPRSRGWIALGAGIAAVVAVGVVVGWLLPRPPGYYGRLGVPFGGLLLFLIVIVIVMFVLRVAFFRARRQRYWEARAGRARRPGFDPAIRTARLRYARGEITRDQYEELVRGLRRPPPEP